MCGTGMQAFRAYRMMTILEGRASSPLIMLMGDLCAVNVITFRKPVLFADTIAVVALTGGVSARNINGLCFCCLIIVIALPVRSAVFTRAVPFPFIFTSHSRKIKVRHLMSVVECFCVGF